MKKLAILVLLLLLVSVLFTSAYQAQVSMPASVQISEYGEGTLDCQPESVSIKAGKTTSVKSFICCNDFLANAKLEVTSTHELVQTIASCCRTIVSRDCKKFNVVYDASEIDPDTCPVTIEIPFHVSADIDSAHVEFTFYVSVEIT